MNSQIKLRRIIVPGISAIAMLPISDVLAQSRERTGIEEIVVTAQRREQSIQDVPIAVSAVTAEAIEVNRVTSVMDLAQLAPNLSLRETAGGIGVPNFSMRGAVSYGSVPGSDKPISLYMDGVYIGNTFGSSFELPDIERIEVLRGPQGTLFGRNATAGAIHVITKEPSGELGFHQLLTAGNYDQFRSSTRIDLPAWHNFSASVSYTLNQRDGDMRNLGAGAVWDRTGPNTGQGIATSPKRLGDQDADAVFVALKYEPSERFKAVYKYDWTQNDFTPEGTALVAPSPERLGPFGDAFAAALAATPMPIAGDSRPKAVNNAFSTPGHSEVQGHNLTLTFTPSEDIDLTLKNILAYRKANVFANADITGASGLVVNKAVADVLAVQSGFPAGSFDMLIGSPYVAGASSVKASIEQWSEEVQFVLNVAPFTLTGGLYYYEDDTFNGAPDGLTSPIFLSPVPGGALFTGQRFFSKNDAKSKAAYAQAEWSVTDQVDLLAGYRYTKDEKSGENFTFAFGTQFNSEFDYDDSRGSYMLGVNYRPTDNLLTYAKYSTGFVSGGSVAGLDFPVEKVKAWEAGVKGDFLDGRVRANLALFNADYKDVQTVIAGLTLNPPRPDITTAIVPEGDLDTQGVELEVTAQPINALTLGGSVGYTDTKWSNVNPFVRDPATTVGTARPRWTADLSALYETNPLFGEASMSYNVNVTYRDKMRTLDDNTLPASYGPIVSSDELVKLNARIALRNIKIGGASAEVALWGKNLTDADNPTFPIDWNYLGSTTYERARTYGVDLIFDF